MRKERRDTECRKSFRVSGTELMWRALFGDVLVNFLDDAGGYTCLFFTSLFFPYFSVCLCFSVTLLKIYICMLFFLFLFLFLFSISTRLAFYSSPSSFSFRFHDDRQIRPNKCKSREGKRHLCKVDGT